jgi:hypothetical protein
MFEEKHRRAPRKGNGIGNPGTKPFGLCHFQEAIKSVFVEANEDIHVFGRPRLPL